MYKIALKKLIEEWYRIKVNPYINGRQFSTQIRSKEYKLLLNLIKSIKRLVEKEYDQEAFNALITDYVAESDIMDSANVSMLFSKEMVQSTIDFYEQAKAFNGEMGIQEIGQAMRNVWIINMIQQLEVKPIKLGSSSFGYSMLYPYTDNLLDDSSIEREYKEAILTRFGRRLSGEQLEQKEERTSYEQDLFKLIEAIENEYPRMEYSMVYESLMGIHNAQLKSQNQHRSSIPYENAILEHTFEKGGTSVLADACIVCGVLTEEQILFYMQYGIVLQLCDDFQDMLEDKANAHQTVFSQLMGHYHLDTLVLKVLTFNEMMVKRLPQVKWASLYRDCILMMIAFSCLDYKPYFSRGFYKEIISYAPFTKKQLNKIRKEIKQSQGLFLNPTTMSLLKTYVAEMSLDI